jgi:hypothetical protein
MSGAQRQSRFERGEDVVVMKFGGTSVEDVAAIRRVISIVDGRLGAKPVLIISALAKVTDHLWEAGMPLLRAIWDRLSQRFETFTFATRSWLIRFSALRRMARWTESCAANYKHWNRSYTIWKPPVTLTLRHRIDC